MTATANDAAPALQGARLVARLLRAHPGWLFAAVALAIAAALAELVPFWLVYLIAAEAMKPAADVAVLIELAVAILAVAIARIILFGAANVVSHRLAFRVQKELRVALVRAVGRLSLGDLEGRTGDLKKSLVEDVDGLERLLAHSVPDVVAGLAAPLFAATLLVFVDWRMAIASLALLPIAVAAQMLAFRDVATVHRQWHAAEASANASLLAYVRGIATLKAYDRVASSLSALRNSVHDLADIADAVTRRTAVPFALFFVALATNLTIVLPVGLVLLALDDLDASSFVLFAVLGAGLTAPLLRVLHAVSAAERQVQGADRIAALLDTPPLPAPAVVRDPLDRSLTFDAVTFGYGPQVDTVSGVSFVAPEGETTAMVGPSGAGKSTLVRLAARYWDVRSGAIRIGGADLREIAPERLNRSIACIFQDPSFFHGTIRENLSVASPASSSARLEATVEAAGLGAVVAALPRGLDTEIGDDASRLSGGERQRLAIARAFLKDAPILLLDEATAFLDPETEFAVHEAIARLTAGRTVLTVAHRLTAVASADSIVVLADGKVDAIGRHADLLETSIVYRRLWTAQRRSLDWRLGA